ncbi:MAG: extensin family protein, partial [Methylocella sp.]
MARRVLPFAVAGALLLALVGCSNYERPRRPAWRGAAEAACLAQKLIHVSAYVQPAREIDGPGICGLTRPFKVSALLDGAVRFNSVYTLDCPMIAALNAWLGEIVQPAARARFGQPVAEIDSMGAYSCRTMNNQPGGRISE